MVRQKGNSGQHITSKLPYGYYNTPENKQVWLIDEEAAEVVREVSICMCIMQWEQNRLHSD